MLEFEFAAGEELSAGASLDWLSFAVELVLDADELPELASWLESAAGCALADVAGLVFDVGDCPPSWLARSR